MINRPQIEGAAARIASHIHQTPIFTSTFINELLEAEVFFKAENLQKTGSFKARGAMNSLLKLSASDAAQGVATHSSGNHGQALAWAARQKNIPSYIVMPENAPAVKVEAVKGYGAEVIFCKANLQAREDTLARVQDKHGAAFIPPYNFHNTIEGQATCAREILAQVGKIDYLLTPVGGGGLLSGSALSMHFFSPEVKVVGCEPAQADDARQSLLAGKLIPADNPQTLADGLRTSLGDITFGYISQYVDEIITCSEDEIVTAMRMIWERMKLVVEASAAVPLACMIARPEDWKGKRIAVILSGGNVDVNHLPF